MTSSTRHPTLNLSGRGHFAPNALSLEDWRYFSYFSTSIYRPLLPLYHIREAPLDIPYHPGT